jgi:drug/metabolite transporter (DMT)-like permease
MINCLAAPFAAAIEWAWLGTGLSVAEVACGLVILAGVGLALAPEKHQPIAPGARLAGILFGVLAGFGQGYGAVLSRKGFAVAAAAGERIDGGTAAFQRILGGLTVVAALFFWLWLRERWAGRRPPRAAPSQEERKRGWGWVLFNGFVGPSLGVACFQWALKTTPSGIVLPITATTPLVVIPFAYFLEGDRPGARSLIGGVVAVLGVVALTVAH